VDARGYARERGPLPGEKEESVRDQVFISYSHLDKKLHEELLLHLKPYVLVSPGFLASGFINDHELGPLLKEAKAGGVRILWVPLRASSYEEETGLKDLQAVSPPERPLAQMSKAARDAAWVRVCKEIKRAVTP
jgi:internalin A